MKLLLKQITMTRHTGKDFFLNLFIYLKAISRLFSEAMDVDKHNAKYRHLLRDAKQQHLLATRVRVHRFLKTKIERFFPG